MSAKAIKSIKPLGFPWETSDPFLFCVYHADAYPKGNSQMGPDASLAGRAIGQDFTIKDGWRMYHGSKVPGFPAHPHCGFETVTVVTKGLVDHSDSLGAAGRFGDGDVQWMTAGKGVQHSEMFPLLNQEGPNPLELFQIWLNLPKRDKKAEPHFAMLWGNTIPKPVFTDAEGKATQVSVMAGALDGHQAPAPAPDSWAADPANDVAIWLISMENGASWALPKASNGINRTIYFYDGSTLSVNGDEIPVERAINLEADAEVNLKSIAGEGKILLLQGKPINEPVVQHGPFVANTQAEIREVITEFHRTEFGGWPWPSHENVHPRERPRFALHADGHEEVKG